MIAQEHDVGALGNCACEARALVFSLHLTAVIECRNRAMKRHRILCQSRQKTILRAGDRCGVRHMRVHHTAGVRSRSVDLAMDLDRGHLATTRAVKNVALKINEQNVARLHLRPVRAIAIEQEDVVVAVDRKRVVIINALVVAMNSRDAQERGDLYAGCGQDLLVNRRGTHRRNLTATALRDTRS